MHYKAAWACGQAALRLTHMPTRRYDHHRLSPLVSTRNDEGPPITADHVFQIIHAIAQHITLKWVLSASLIIIFRRLVLTSDMAHHSPEITCPDVLVAQNE